MRRSSLVAVALVVLLVAIGLFWVRRGGQPAAVREPTRPNLILITIDTLRADRVGRGLTPAIDALGARGVVFENARTAAPLTLPSHVTIMTGARPPVHGVRQNGVVFRPGPQTLAQGLRNAGYHTGAFVGAYVLDHRFGLSDGFDVYNDDVPRDPARSQALEAERRADQVVDAALAWLRDVPPPFFAWIHLYDPHAPYDPPKEFLARANGDPYDGEVAYADAEAGRVVDLLRQRGLSDDGVIVLAGDHGEGLGEHNERTHGMLAYDSTLRVPLVLVAPATRQQGHVSDVVSLADIAPTLLTLAQVNVPDTMSGSSLFSRREGDAYAETEYPRMAGWHPIAALADARWKLLLSSEPELYDLEADPGETRNVANARAGLVDAMSRRLRELGRAAEGSSPGRIDPEAAARLRSLGYVSGARAAASATAPNPARVIQEWAAFERALEQVNAGRPKDAIPALEALASRFAGSLVFEGTLARALMEGGHGAAALQRYRSLVKQHPNDAMLFHDLAVAARNARQPAEALRAEQAALTLDADDPAALDGLGLLHADAGRPADAAAAFERAARLDPRNPSHWSNLGNARRELGDLAAAESAYRRALTVDPNYPDALNGVGVLLVQRGAAAEAIPLLTRALARTPDFHEARLNLGIAYQESGQVAKAAQVYRDLLARAPKSASRERAAAQKLLDSLH